LDIDSTTFDRFDKDDQQGLESIVNALAHNLAQQQTIEY